MAKASAISRFDLNNKSLYVKVVYNPHREDLFSIKIFDTCCSWSGRFTNVEAEIHRERLEETEDVYFENVKKGLSNNPDYIQDFEMKPDDDYCLARFSWRKKFKSAVLLHGSVTVSRDEVADTKEILLNALVHENEELRKSLDSVMLMNKELHLDLEKCKKSLDEAIENKKETEEALYSKFVELLNSKKRRIELLEENISNSSKS